MALTKAGIIESVHQQFGFPQKKSTELVEQLIETIKSTLASREDVLVSGFGKFCVNNRKGEERQKPGNSRFDDAETAKDGYVQSFGNIEKDY